MEPNKMIIEIPEKPERVWDLNVPILKSVNGDYMEIYLTDAIKEPMMYCEVFYEIKTAKSGCTIKLIINSGGGIVSTATMLEDALRETKAKTIAHVTGCAASAATTIALTCDELTMSDGSEFMVHNYSHGTHGTGAQVKEYVDFVDRESAKGTRKIYEGFLTPEEIELIINHDKEIWLNKDETIARWNNRKSLIRAKSKNLAKDND